VTSRNQSISFADLEWNLPLFDDLYLSMQGQNVMLVDFYMRDLERELLREYVDLERTPLQSTMMVSALSQMWVFAAYELLRTWRQRVRQLKKDVQKPAVPEKKGQKQLAGLYLQGQLEQLRKDKAFGAELDRAYARVEPMFRRIEALRMNLAKHEVAKTDGVPAIAPGYGRIHILTGSIQWQVDLGGNAVELVTRQDLGDYLRSIVIGGPTARERKQAKAKRPGEKKK